jgi:hypothetical protein
MYIYIYVRNNNNNEAFFSICNTVDSLLRLTDEWILFLLVK